MSLQQPIKTNFWIHKYFSIVLGNVFWDDWNGPCPKAEWKSWNNYRKILFWPSSWRPRIIPIKFMNDMPHDTHGLWNIKMQKLCGDWGPQSLRVCSLMKCTPKRCSRKREAEEYSGLYHGNVTTSSRKVLLHLYIYVRYEGFFEKERPPTNGVCKNSEGLSPVAGEVFDTWQRRCLR